MAQNAVTTGFSQYSPRRLERVAFGSFAGTGIDAFTDPTAQNPSLFQQLTNVLPTISGAFNRRWAFADITPNISPANYVRMFGYSASADVTFSGTVDTRVLVTTDNTNIFTSYVDVGPGPTYGITPFSGTGQVFAVNSRDWLYACDGAGYPRKINFSQNSVDTNTNWGIATPAGASVDGMEYLDLSTPSLVFAGVVGENYISPVVTITGGGGTGATAVATANAGGIWGITLSNPGNGYTSIPTVTITDSVGSGTGAQALAIVGGDSTDTLSYQTVMSIVLTGTIVLNAGRTYAIALKNSVTGHTSDFIYQQGTSKYKTFADFIASPAEIANSPGFNLNQGCTNIIVPLTIPDSSVDPQVDTVVLLATSDGGSIAQLYEVSQIPLTSFTHSGGSYTLVYQDTLPDTVNDVYITGPTLLTNNLWVDTDSAGDVSGIDENTPPPNIINKPVLHKGRLFATDGKSLFFSKSIDEVTTSTGLITSKWEEAWPGSNQLDIAYDDELITALLSDGDILYIGTTDNIYRLLGDSSTNFTIPASVFRGVGVSSQDCWSVIYKDNIPAGYMWMTPDNKVMLSDFNTYKEIGQPIYPLLAGNAPCYMQSISYGPYSLAMLTCPNTLTSQPTYFVYDTKNYGWYTWEREITSSLPGTFPPSPIYSWTLSTGIQRMFTYVTYDNSGTFTQSLQYFNPNSVTDDALMTSAASYIPFFIETSWLNLQDTASDVILNELEVWSQDPSVNVSVYKAKTSADFVSPVLVKTGPLATSPLGITKLYLAGANSFGRYHKVQFFTNSTTGLSPNNPVLRQFQFEHYPQTRS